MADPHPKIHEKGRVYPRIPETPGPTLIGPAKNSPLIKSVAETQKLRSIT
jgi:hypothetical protein